MARAERTWACSLIEEIENRGAQLACQQPASAPGTVREAHIMGPADRPFVVRTYRAVTDIGDAGYPVPFR